jgi:predicted Fe-Mo cluster-binding NifX family protein
MRLAIAVDGGYVSAHFGRCPAFLIVDIDESGNVIKQEMVENPGAYGHQPGLVPKFLQSIGVDCVIAGGMGPNAIMMLEAAGIKPILGVTGRVEDVLNAFLAGTLQGGESLCDHSHRCEH